MGVFKRYKDAQAAQKDAENAMPGAYQSNYTDRINEALDSMGAASNAGYDVGTDSDLYRQYRAGAQANARAAAENAAAGAAALSGGYGSSYANSVAQQGYQKAMANVDDGLAGLRDKALTMYQLKQNGRADQAAQEKSDFLSNLWEMAKSVGRAGLTAYDTYKGYTQQQWENEFAREQWEYNKERTGQSDALNAYEQAFNLYQQGADDAANAVLGRYGLDTGIFDNYSGAPITRADKAGALTTAAGLAGGGSDEAARAVLELYGLDPNSVGDYRTIAGRQLATALAKAAASGSSGGNSRRGSSSSGSGGTKSSGSGWTNSQLLTALGKYQALKDDDPTKNIYAGILQAGGLLETPTNGMKSITDDVLNRVAGYAQRGMNGSAITVKLQHEGYSNEEIAEIFNRVGI